MRLDVGFKPLLGGAYLGEVGDLVIGDSNCDGDAGVSEGSEYVGVGVKEPNTVDNGGFQKEVGDFGRRRKVIRLRAIVHSYRSFPSYQQKAKKKKPRLLLA